MKLRIKGNSIRLRLTKSEVERLSAEDYLEERTSIGSNTFVYSLECRNDINELSAEFLENKITVYIPELFVKEWTINDTIGIETNFRNGNDKYLNIIVEKDFKCLDETTEDQSDNYENPNQNCR